MTKLLLNTARLDPSRTGLLQRRFLKEINRGLQEFSRNLHKLIVDDDTFALTPRKPLVLLAEREYAFATDAQKLEAFHKWVEDQVNSGILRVSGKGTPGKPWTYEYIEPAYRRGIGRAYDDVSKPALAPSIPWYAGGKNAFLTAALIQPVSLRKVELLALRSYQQLTGITATMDQQLSRILATAMASGWSPIKTARAMQKSIGSLSRTRARMIARTEIIYAHAEGQLDGFTLLGVDQIGILPEWSTAGDDLVCRLCRPYEGKVYTVDEARGLIPLHPNCRCVWIPHGSADR